MTSSTQVRLPANRITQGLASPMGARITSYFTAVVGYSLLALWVERVPSIPAIAEKLIEEFTNGHVWGNFAITGARFFIAIFLATVIGVLIGLLTGLSRIWRAGLSDLLIVAMAIPGVVWTFLCVMWFGLGTQTAIVTAILAATPFVAVNVSKGVRAVPRDLLDMSHAYGVTTYGRIRHLLLPGVMGYVVAGVRLAIILGWNAIIVAEWFGASDGVGYRSRYWYDGNQFAGFVGWLVLFIVFIVVLDRLFLDRLLQRAFRWRDATGGSMSAV